jgi:hypothetical protein
MKDIIDKLKPIKEIEPNWFKLKWKPIKNGTYNFYILKYPDNKIRFRIYTEHVNGWGRSWDGFVIELFILGYFISFWVHYNYIAQIKTQK